VLDTDLVKDESTLVAAYDDGERVTAAFNVNILRWRHRELGANFDLNAFRHHALWNSGQARIEMHLESIRDQTVLIPATDQSPADFWNRRLPSRTPWSAVAAAKAGKASCCDDVTTDSRQCWSPVTNSPVPHDLFAAHTKISSCVHTT
jgi:uncharacterized protein (DUF849 family)